MKRLVIIIILTLPSLLKAQEVFTGTAKDLLSYNAKVSLIDQDTLKVLKVTKNTKGIRVEFGGQRYVISTRKRLVVSDYAGAELLTSIGKGMLYSQALGDTLFYTNCRVWNICVTDRSGGEIARGEYQIRDDLSKISVVLAHNQDPVAALIAFRLLMKSKEDAEATSMSFLMSSIL